MPLARRADRAQGQPLHARPDDDRRLAHPRALRPAVQRDRRSSGSIAAGAVIVGKTNCDEFAMGSSTENSAFGPTRNPWATDRTPGGSSGGSAAAVAARMVPLALGSDTGGSIRQPAALCGVVGLKPTYGRVSRYGLLAFASSLDQIGPFATSVADAALCLQVIAGARSARRDVRDGRDRRLPRRADRSGRRDAYRRPARARLGRRGVDAEVPDRVRTGARDAAAAGRRRSSTSRCRTARTRFRSTTSSPTAEASSNLARYDGVRYGYRAPDARDARRDVRPHARPRVRRRRSSAGSCSAPTCSAPATTTPTTSRRSRCARSSAATTSRRSRRVDLVAMPTSPTPAFALGERMDDPLQMYLADVFTVAANLAGLPSISVPCGFTAATAAVQPAAHRPRRWTRRRCCAPPTPSSG